MWQMSVASARLHQNVLLCVRVQCGVHACALAVPKARGFCGRSLCTAGTQSTGPATLAPPSAHQRSKPHAPSHTPTQAHASPRANTITCLLYQPNLVLLTQRVRAHTTTTSIKADGHCNMTRNTPCSHQPKLPRSPACPKPHLGMISNIHTVCVNQHTVCVFLCFTCANICIATHQGCTFPVLHHTHGLRA